MNDIRLVLALAMLPALAVAPRVTAAAPTAPHRVAKAPGWNTLITGDGRQVLTGR